MRKVKQLCGIILHGSLHSNMHITYPFVKTMADEWWQSLCYTWNGANSPETNPGMQLASCECYNSCQLLPCSATTGIYNWFVTDLLKSLHGDLLVLIFYVLIAQLHRDFRKPLIVMAPKNLLRHKDCKSNLSEFDDEQGHPGFDKQGTRFKRLIKDQNDHSDKEEGIRRLVLCSGKVCYMRLLSSSHFLCLEIDFHLERQGLVFSVYIATRLEVIYHLVQCTSSLYAIYLCRFTMSSMLNGRRSVQMMLQYVGWSNFAHSLMILSSESWSDIQVLDTDLTRCL